MKDSLFDRVIAGDSNAVARAISKVEDGAEGVSDLMKQIFPRTGRALDHRYHRRPRSRKIDAG